LEKGVTKTVEMNESLSYIVFTDVHVSIAFTIAVKKYRLESSRNCCFRNCCCCLCERL